MKTNCDYNNLITVIVPVFNVQEYLPKCADSLIKQTYRDLEIIFIDDGSTDNSGGLCDEYAEIDSRIRVLHTKNGGLSRARNVGLDNIKGQWVAFVDSDDWVETTMMEMLINEAIASGADCVECGVIDEYPNHSTERKMTGKKTALQGHEILRANIIDKSIENYAWNKIYKADLFNDIRFLPGRNYEDVEVTHRIIKKCKKITIIPECYYHYRQREGTITRTFELKNLFDLWQSYYEKYNEYCELGEDFERSLLEPCIHAAGTIWVWTNRSKKEEKIKYNNDYSIISNFIASRYKKIKRYHYPRNYKIKAFFTRYNRRWSFVVMDYIGRINSGLKRTK